MVQHPDLVPIHPVLFSDLVCPSCGSSDLQAKGTVWPGIHVMGRYLCTGCGLDMLRDLPVGFAVDHPMAIDRATGRLFNPTNGEGWIHGPLMRAFGSPSDAPVHIERIVRRKASRVVILNTLDFLYGHVLLKLFNAQHYLEKWPDLGLVLVLPKSYAWLVPEGVAEVWLVDLGLGRMQQWHTAIDAFVQERSREYEEIHLARAYSHPEHIRIEGFTGIRPFDRSGFDTAPAHVTFVAREDRLWFASPFGKFCYRVLNKLGVKNSIGRWFVQRQDRLILRTMREIRKARPGTRFTVVGLGTPALARYGAEDLRTRKMDADTERAWCQAYARSQVVVGVHGSNMLLPTVFAGGCVEILPHDRYGNIVQDVSVRWTGRMQLFLYRFVDEFATPRQVACHVVSMFQHYSLFHRNNEVNVFH